MATLLGALAFAGLSAYGDVHALQGHLASLPAWVLVVTLLLVTGNYALRFVRWQYYLRVLELQVPTGESLLVFVSGFVMSITPGKVGEVFKSLLLHQSRGLAVATTAPIVFAERLTDLLALAVLTALGCLSFEHGVAVALTALTIVGGLVLATAYRPFGEACIAGLGRLPLLRRAVPRLKEAYLSLYAMTRPRPMLVASVLATAGWALECVAMFAIVSALRQHAVGLPAAAFAYAASTLAGAVAMLPGGLGVTEIGMAGLLQALGRGQVSPSIASACTILIRLATLWFAVLLGVCALALWKARHAPKNEVVTS